MHIRYLKIMFAAITSLMALIYVTQNIANLHEAHQAVLYVMSGADHKVYPNSFGFHSSNPTLAWVVAFTIFAGEYAAGFFLARGVFEMWRQRKASNPAFRAAMKWAQIGAGIGILVWFGFFGVIGAAFFQMWQTQVGAGSMNGAFQYFASCALTLLFLNQPDTTSETSN